MARGPEAADLLAALARKGLKSTAPRRAILDALLEIGRSAALDEIHRRVQEKSPRVGFSTVFRTMKTLVALGLARELRLADGVARYEIGRDEPIRAHFHCRSCGLLEELPAARMAAPLRGIKRLARGRADAMRIEVAGLCAKCLADLPARKPRG